MDYSSSQTYFSRPNGTESNCERSSTIYPSSLISSLTWQAPSNFDRSLPGKAIATTFIPAASPPFTPSGESSNTIQCSGGIPAIEAAFRKMSGAGFPFLTSSAVTIDSKRSIISWKWIKSNRAYLVRSQLGSNEGSRSRGCHVLLHSMFKEEASQRLRSSQLLERGSSFLHPFDVSVCLYNEASTQNEQSPRDQSSRPILLCPSSIEPITPLAFHKSNCDSRYIKKRPKLHTIRSLLLQASRTP